jgi:hypothetical protein
MSQIIGGSFFRDLREILKPAVHRITKLEGVMPFCGGTQERARRQANYAKLKQPMRYWWQQEPK